MSENADAHTANSNQINTKTHVLKYVFKNVSTMVQNRNYNSSTEEYFGVPWHICIKRIKDYLAVYLYCDRPKNEKEWSIEIEYKIQVFHPNGKSTCKTGNYCFKEATGRGWPTFLKWETMENEYLVNDELIVEVLLKTMKVTGIYGENLRNFDDEECSDVTLVVNDRRFHVARLYLCTHSLYFKTMFLGRFEESKKSEIELNGVDADDLQKYLEVLYGEDAIDEMTVEGILSLADIYDTKILFQKCEKFLLESSKKTLKKKLEMAMRYNLNELKNKCLSEIKTVEDIREVVPEYINQMDPSFMADMTVESILMLADLYDTNILVQKCGKFLLEISKKTLRKKLEMALKYNLLELTDKCLRKVNSIADIREVVPVCINQMDPSIMAVVLKIARVLL
ncbi:unnamed protein product [Caenorhabditis brenneri]